MRIRELIWSEENEAHILRHNVRRVEAEYVCFSNRSLGVRVRGERYRILGQSETGRYLAVFLDESDSGKFHVVTARDATDSERRRLNRWRGR